MASLNLAGKTSGYVKLTAPDDSSNNPTVTLPTESGELALKSDIGEGGGGSGGDYTPEKMVWEDVKADRVLNKKYTNTNDVPLYVQIFANSTTSYLNLYIDDVRVGAQGGSVTGGNVVSTNLYIVPSGSTYEAKGENGFVVTDIKQWQEARMPVAVGTGGKTVVFRGELSADQTGVANSTWTKVNLDTISTDADGKKYGNDSDFVDGKFQPSVAGYYQINGQVGSAASPAPTNLACYLKKNGVYRTYGTSVTTSMGSFISNTSDVIYLNGDGDYVELFAQLTTSGTPGFKASSTQTFLSAILVSGGSASGGDSIWTEEDGSVLYSAEDRARILLSETNSNRGVNVGSWGSTKYLEGTGDGNFVISHNSDSDYLVFKTGYAGKNSEAMKIIPDGRTYMYGVNNEEGAAPPNVAIGSDGQMFKSTTAMYSAEEVDKKLAIKDKLIEKLSERLDKLEKKLKK